MIIFIALCAWIIIYYTKSKRILKNYQHITGTCIKSEYWSRRKRVGGSYETTVQYYFNNRTYEKRLRYNTKKKYEGEIIDCLIDPEHPESIYPDTAIQTNNKMIALAWILIIIAILLQTRDIMLLLVR